MKYRVLFTLYHDIKKTPVRTGYRPDWTSNHKPEYNCGQLTFQGEEIKPGYQRECILTPVMLQLWETVITKDTLRCMEGSRQVGDAVVIEVIP